MGIEDHAMEHPTPEAQAERDKWYGTSPYKFLYQGALNRLGTALHATSVSKGFYERDTEGNVSLPSEKLALLHEEVSEIVGALRDDDSRKEAVECADVLIRLLDYCAWRGIDLDGATAAKLLANEKRGHLHGRTF